MAQVKFKYGLFQDLNAKKANGIDWEVPISEGSIYVTTDTHSMFMDLPSTDTDENGKYITKRFRIGDFERYEKLKDLVDDAQNWYDGSLALIEKPSADSGTDTDINNANQTPILAYYTNGTWININDTTTLEEALQGNIDKVAGDLATLSGTVGGNSASIAAIRAEIGEKPDGTTATVWQAISNLIGGDSEEDLSLASLQAAIEKNAEDISTNAGNISANTEAISAEVQRASAAESALDNRITDIENDLTNNTANYATITYVDTAVDTAKEEAIDSANGYTDAQIAAAKGEVNGYTDTKVAAEKSRAEGVEAALQQDIDKINHTTTGILAKAKEYTDALANGAVANNTQAIAGINNTTTGILAQAKAYTDKEVTAEEARATGVETALGNRLETLEGSDSGQSVRQISANEVAKIVANAPASFDTLKEIADWIQSDTTGAAAMNLHIGNLEKISASFIYEKDESGDFVVKEDGNLKRLDTVTQDAIKAYIDTMFTAIDNKLNWGTF